MADPVRALETVPSVTLDNVFFERGNLWQARYPTLIDHGHAPDEIQLEPAFEVFAESAEAVFRIAIDQDAVFETLGGAVRFDRLTPPDRPVADVSVTLVEGDPRTCRVVWTRKPDARCTALRLVCRHETGGPEPGTDAWVRTRVEGGVYLVIVDGGEARAFPEPVRNESAGGVPGRVQVIGINEANSRPIYDLFRMDFACPPEIAPEPAFRASHGERIDFPLALDLPPEYHGVLFATDGEGQVAMSYEVPRWRPESLLGSPAGEDGRLCTVQWHHAALTSCVTGSPEAGTDLCRLARTANLYAQLDPGPRRGTLSGDALALVSVDPTVIEPPACDAGGICTRPRDGEE